MARYTDAVCRLCRREGRKLYLKGDRCESPKCAITKRNFPPGQHGLSKNKLSPYGQQLREKQRAKRYYGVLERQFHKTFERAERMKGVTGTLLLQLLETRLDNMVYRLGLAPSRAGARQLVRHGNVTVNGQKVDIPSFQVRVGHEISVRERFKEAQNVKDALEQAGKRERLTWLETNLETTTGRLLSMPARADIPVDINEQLIVELYSK